jgi:hypothetical protein
MQTIVIETARFDEQKSDFVYSTHHRFPRNAKGLTLAVIAADRLMQIEASHTAFADITIRFEGLDLDDNRLDDAKMFELIGSHKAGYPIIKDCFEIIVALSEQDAKAA